MSSDELIAQIRSSLSLEMPLPGKGRTAERHKRLWDIGRCDLSLARLAEAHWDAVSILAEAGRPIRTNTVYGVWASETPGHGLTLTSDGVSVSGTKMFCSGAALIDRALVTVSEPQRRLVDIDLRANRNALSIDESEWKTPAFAETRTATVAFSKARVDEKDILGPPCWYLDRPGFWHGACGPAACWAGGAAGLVDFACKQTRNDPHTMAHLAAMKSSLWALRAYLEIAGHEMDRAPADGAGAKFRALSVRHLVEQACTEILQRFARAYGPFPLAMNEGILKRYSELDLYLRQSHGERDLETLGRLVREHFHPPHL